MKTTRDITLDECHWLDEAINSGTEVHEYKGHTYGCISPIGMAVTLVKDTAPFFELPRDSLDIRPMFPPKKRYSVSFNSIIEAENEVDAIQIFKESAEYGSVECFEYGPVLPVESDKS